MPENTTDNQSSDLQDKSPLVGPQFSGSNNEPVSSLNPIALSDPKPSESDKRRYIFWILIAIILLLLINGSIYGYYKIIKKTPSKIETARGVTPVTNRNRNTISPAQTQSSGNISKIDGSSMKYIDSLQEYSFNYLNQWTIRYGASDVVSLDNPDKSNTQYGGDVQIDKYEYSSFYNNAANKSNEEKAKLYAFYNENKEQQELTIQGYKAYSYTYSTTYNGFGNVTSYNIVIAAPRQLLILIFHNAKSKETLSPGQAMILNSFKVLN